ncbi:hypothetical protein ACFV9C_17825 [Kribbella sp. NPDC059898]|uniref:hypothetical protein n=1 Tax=Kribbella sp. NPDC059898 TaxID=3346995 RepID=UPI00364F0DB7
MRAALALLAVVALTGYTSIKPSAEVAPKRFRIVPDDYHVPYAGTAQDGRKFFLSDELFAATPATSACTSRSPTARSTR